MISTRLNANGRPNWAADATGGRFIACRAGFYDPAVFEKNREVSFTGRIDGYENRRIGGYDYRFPHVAADVVYLWPIRERVNVITRPAPWPRWGWWRAAAFRLERKRPGFRAFCTWRSRGAGDRANAQRSAG